VLDRPLSGQLASPGLGERDPRILAGAGFFPAGQGKAGKEIEAAPKTLSDSCTSVEIYRSGREKIFPANRASRETAGKVTAEADPLPCLIIAHRILVDLVPKMAVAIAA
jgi:hypothetical protein